MWWRAIFNRVDETSLSDAEKERLHHYTVLLVLGIPFLVAFGVYDFLGGNHLLVALIAATMIGVVFAWLALLKMPNGQVVYRFVSGLYFALVLYMVAMADQDGSKILWVYTFPLITFFILGHGEGLYWIGGLFAIVLFLLWVPLEWLNVYPYPSIFKVRFLATFAMVSAITCLFYHTRRRYKLNLEHEHRQLELEKDRLQIEIVERKKVEKEREALIAELKETLDKVNTLRGLIPICANCHSVRDDKGYWNHLENFFQEHSDAEFSHGICPECKKKLYPHLYPDK